MSLIKIDWNPPPRTLRSFGIICLVGFPLLALMAWYRVMALALLSESAAPTVALVLSIIGGLCGLLALAMPAALKPLFIGMSIVAAPIGFVVSNTLLIVLYFLVITPISLIFRLIGRDALHRKFDRAAATYWIERNPVTDMKRYFRQF